MGKTTAYVVTAVLLAIVAMLPVIVFSPKRADQSCFILSGETHLPYDSERSRLLEEYGLAEGPLSPFNLGLILVIGFVSAFGVSFYFKRKMA